VKRRKATIAAARRSGSGRDERTVVIEVQGSGTQKVVESRNDVELTSWGRWEIERGEEEKQK